MRRIGSVLLASVLLLGAPAGAFAATQSIKTGVLEGPDLHCYAINNGPRAVEAAIVLTGHEANSTQEVTFVARSQSLAPGDTLRMAPEGHAPEHMHIAFGRCTVTVVGSAHFMRGALCVFVSGACAATSEAY